MPAPKARCEYRLPPDVYLEVERRARECGISRSEYVEGCLRGSWARWDALDGIDGIVPLPRRLPSPPPGFTLRPGEQVDREFTVPEAGVDRLTQATWYGSPTTFLDQAPPARRRWWQRRERS